MVKFIVMLISALQFNMNGQKVETSSIQPIYRIKNRFTLSLTCNQFFSTSSEAKAVSRTHTNGGTQVVEIYSPQYIPFKPMGWQCTWAWNEILDPAYSYTNNGSSHWPEIQAASTGNLWAIYTGTNNAYNYDSVFVFMSDDGGQNWWLYIVIYSATPGYSPYVARLSVNRDNDWIYVADILGDNSAGGGSYYPGTMWITSWHDNGDGTISNLGTYQCDPQGWGDTYGKCAVASDGGNNGYVYLMGVDWVTDVWDPDFYVDYYRSADHGQTWTYIHSLDMGTSATDVISGAPRYNNGGAVFSFCDWDDASSLYDLYYTLVTPTSDNWYYFDLDDIGLQGIYSPAADGGDIYLPYDVQNGYDYDAYFIASTDNGSSWTQYSHWSNANPNYDTRSIGFDATPGRAYMAYFEDTDDADHTGSVYFAYASDADLSTWYSWRTLDNPAQDYGLQCTNDLITVGNNESWEIVDPTFLFSLDSKPHIAWRRTAGASGGGEGWHSWPVDPVYFEIGEKRGEKLTGNLKSGVYLLTSNIDLSNFTVYELDGRIAKNPVIGRIYFLKQK